MSAERGYAVKDYLSELKTVNNSSPGYIRGIRTALRGFNRSMTGDDTADEYIKVSAVTESDVKEWIGDMRDRGNINQTVRTNVARLRTFFDFLIESPDHRMKVNPCSRLYKKLPAGRTQTKRPYKSVEEVAEFIKTITHPRDRCMIALLAKTGIRRSELTGLNVDDIDLDNDVIHIMRRFDDESRQLLPGRKNGETTDIPIDDELHRLLQIHLTLRPRTRDNAIFLSYTGMRLSGAGLNLILKEWVKKHWGTSGKATSEKITPHWFRAFLTYELSVNGCNPVVIAAVRGDRAAKIQDFYTMQVLGFQKIKEEYLRTVPQFGL